MKRTISILFCFLTSHIHAQELFTWSEPASNMAAKAIGFRANNGFMKENLSDKYDYYLAPEIMWGISAKLMIHVEGFFSNQNNGFAADGASLYFKYRFLSNDEVHSHFRMAAYGRIASSNNHIHERAINLNGHNSGYEAGLIATKLVNKVAISASAGLLHAADNADNHKFYYDDKYRNALAYNLSFGKLMLPKEYTSYKQTNLNLMLELLGQTNLAAGESYLDIAPVIQFIILSKMRIDASYHFALVKDLYRNAENGFLLRLEYNIFNVYK
ncbi:MAG: hypothetical protein QM737_03485 [Ferruginibacter sp.]